VSNLVTWWPAAPAAMLKILNGHISATGRLIHFMFGARMGFSGSADRMALLPVGPDPRRRPFQVAISLQRVIRSTSFLPARRYASVGLCDSDVSVCLSVCLSHAGIVPSRAKAGS